MQDRVLICRIYNYENRYELQNGCMPKPGGVRVVNVSGDSHQIITDKYID